MKIKSLLLLVLFIFVCWCGYLVYATLSGEADCGFCRTGKIMSLAATGEGASVTDDVSGVNESSDGARDVVVSQKVVESIFDLSRLRAVSAGSEKRLLGSKNPESGYKFQIELDSKGAAIREAVLNEFMDRNREDPQPLKVLSAVNSPRVGEVLSLSNKDFLLADLQEGPFPLDVLEWEAGMVRRSGESEEVSFRAKLMDANKEEAFLLRKTYRIEKGSYNVECRVRIENLTDVELSLTMLLQGPTGIVREGFRGDMRDVTAAFSRGDKIESTKKDMRKVRGAFEDNDSEELNLAVNNSSAGFVWAAITNKYFAAIARPVPGENNRLPMNVGVSNVQYYDPDDPDLSEKANDDESLSFDLVYKEVKLPVGSDGGSVEKVVQLYLGPKDIGVFRNNDLYDRLGYLHTIKFLGCCCPQSIINPLAFGIMTLMKWIYTAMGPLGNYGIVIMILVAVVRLLLHPITKKSQVSMMRMQKLGPKMEEIKKKYEGNKAELNKHIMQLYREQGVSPVSAFLPMFLQLPILIALYSAIYANVELRGAAFLPFWITDLSIPDALISFETITIPLVGWEIESFNLLPLLLGGVMFAQQKLMPTKSATTNPQMAQQQKMMMWMMPIMMLLIFYKMPSGLNLYFMSSTLAGVVEQVVIRKHIREKEDQEEARLVPATSKTGGKTKKKKPKPFFKNTM
jgi:YidC/Oxa1 family membrane protein insertase